jgi:hypothetical protein
MNRTEIAKYFDSLLLSTYEDYCRKNRYDIENIKKTRVKSDKFTIPQLNEHYMMITNNYELKQLKEITKHYKLKCSGNKEMLIARIFSYLYLSMYLLKIQKLSRRYLSKKIMKFHGPAYLNRDLCVNAIDFLTMDDVKDIIPTQFFSYKDTNNFIYGFDVISFHNLIKNAGNNIILNPFTKLPIHFRIIHKFKRMVYLSNLLNIPINLKMEEIETTELVVKNSSDEALELFQYIDRLGNYTNVNWFMNLTKDNLLHLIIELIELWNYRLDLTTTIKIKICNPSGNPFYNENILPNQTLIQHLSSMPTIEQVRLGVLEILSNFVKKGLTEEYKKIGAYFVLGALTLVSSDAGYSLPWLYESFSYN